MVKSMCNSTKESKMIPKDFQTCQKTLDRYNNFIYDHAAEFLNSYTHGKGEYLVDVTFDSVHVHFTYLHEEGVAFTDIVSVSTFFNWMKKLEEEE